MNPSPAKNKFSNELHVCTSCRSSFDGMYFFRIAAVRQKPKLNRSEGCKDVRTIGQICFCCSEGRAWGYCSSRAIDFHSSKRSRDVSGNVSADGMSIRDKRNVYLFRKDLEKKVRENKIDDELPSTSKCRICREPTTRIPFLLPGTGIYGSRASLWEDLRGFYLPLYVSVCPRLRRAL